MTITLHHGDSLEVLRTLPENSIDAVVTDPPYGLAFMSKKWDYDVPSVELWEECLRVLKPGGHLLAFAGTRTQHRMAVRIEDAGFEIRDMIAWVYGSGFPKSHNLKDDWDGWGTALKPALEPITVARKPFKGPVAANVLKHGTGAINIEGCRVHGSPGAGWNGVSGFGNNVLGKGWRPDGVQRKQDGRWPANLIHDGSDEVLALFPETAGDSAGRRPRNENGKVEPGFTGGWGIKVFNISRTDSGTAARYFYSAKASKKDRGEGNNHPTVKPTDLMRYLCRLVTPPGGTVLDPFMGSGSTGKAAILEGFSFIGIEREAEYIAIARARIEAAQQEALLFTNETK